MKISRLNNIFFYLLCSQLIFISGYFYHTPLISDSINTNKAIFMHVIGIIWFMVGYFTGSFAHALQKKPIKEQVDDRQYSFSNAYYVCSYLLIIAGLIIAISQVIYFIPLTEYISELLSGDFEQNIRVIFLLSAEEGGFPGIVKMFGYAPLSIYLMSLGHLNFTPLSAVDKRRLRILSILALGAIVIKVFFSLDRLTILAVLAANIFVGFNKGYIKKIRYWLLIVFIVFLANYLSTKRLQEGLGIINFTLLYFKLGLVNFQFMLDTVSKHTYGFATIFAPAYFIFKFFNFPLPDVFDIQAVWEWNSAQYFSSYAFQDFGYFYFILFYVVGIFLYQIDNQVKKNIYVNSIFFIVLYGALSFVVVPAIRGVEFWLALLLPLILVNQFTKKFEYSIIP